MTIDTRTITAAAAASAASACAPGDGADAIAPLLESLRVAAESSWWYIGMHVAMVVLLFVLVVRVHHRVLRRQNVELIELVRETTSELIATNARLERANAELQRLSDADGLTGLANRRRFDAYLASEWRHAFRTAAPLGLVFLDLDHFKRLNDALGHLAGDAALRAVACTLRDEVRRSADLVARYGGEEFAVLLTTTDLDGAKEMAERLIHAVENLHYAHPDSPIAQWLTISAGVASVVPTPELNPSALFEAADRALYQAKREGRNRIATAGVADPEVTAATPPSTA